jgi:hypothetical protein
LRFAGDFDLLFRVGYYNLFAGAIQEFFSLPSAPCNKIQVYTKIQFIVFSRHKTLVLQSFIYILAVLSL